MNKWAESLAAQERAEFFAQEEVEDPEGSKAHLTLAEATAASADARERSEAARVALAKRDADAAAAVDRPSGRACPSRRPASPLARRDRGSVVAPSRLARRSRPRGSSRRPRAPSGGGRRCSRCLGARARATTTRRTRRSRPRRWSSSSTRSRAAPSRAAAASDHGFAAAPAWDMPRRRVRGDAAAPAWDMPRRRVRGGVSTHRRRRAVAEDDPRRRRASPRPASGSRPALDDPRSGPRRVRPQALGAAAERGRDGRLEDRASARAARPPLGDPRKLPRQAHA